MSQQTKEEVLTPLRRRYVSAGREHQHKLIQQAVELLGYHRKAAIRALGRRAKPPTAPGLIWGRPRQYHPDALLPIPQADLVCGLQLSLYRKGGQYWVA